MDRERPVNKYLVGQEELQVQQSEELDMLMGGLFMNP